MLTVARRDGHIRVQADAARAGAALAFERREILRVDAVADALADWGIAPEEIAKLREPKAID